MEPCYTYPTELPAMEVWKMIRAGSPAQVVIYDHDRDKVLFRDGGEGGHQRLWSDYADEIGVPEEVEWMDSLYGVARGYWIPDTGTLALYGKYGPRFEGPLGIYKKIADAMGIDHEEIDLYVEMY